MAFQGVVVLPRPRPQRAVEQQPRQVGKRWPCPLHARMPRSGQVEIPGKATSAKKIALLWGGTDSG